METDNYEERCTSLEDSELPEPKKKRKTEMYRQLPHSSTIGLDPEIVEELQAAFEILQTIMKISKIEAFLVKPNSDLFGMSSYYSIIKKPMWLNEVHRKLMDREYSGIKEVVEDIKLLLENCYRFWGPSHRVTKKGLHIEHKLEQKLEELPTVMKHKCLESDKPNEVIFKTEHGDGDECMGTIEPLENHDERTLECKDENYCYTYYKGFQSTILKQVLNSKQYELISVENMEEQKKREEKMLLWEREQLVNEQVECQIKHMYQLAEIGQFLKLTCVMLNVEEITQYEVERMLLMPRESTSLATLMTSMLSPATLRSSLDVTPIMPYEVWTAKLKKKIEDWLKVFYKTNAVEALNRHGVEPYFWEIIGLVNPLEEKRFHEIPFFERVWIVKSLCDNILHTNKSVQDIFLDEEEGSEVRATEFGRGPGGYYYFGLQFLPEIRVYKQNKVMNKVWAANWCRAETGVLKLLKNNLLSQWNEDEKRVEFLPNPKNFSMEADSVDSLADLIDNLKNKGFNTLLKNLTKYLTKVKKHKCRPEGLEAVYTQWHEYQNRAPEYFTNLLNLWLATENPSYKAKEGREEEGEGSCPILGKRRSSTKTSLVFIGTGVESSEESNQELLDSDDISDWEEETCKRNKKKKNGNNKRKRSKCSNQEDSLSNMEEVKIYANSEGLDSYKRSVQDKYEVDKGQYEFVGIKAEKEIKKEKEDIIEISSDEEESGGPPPQLPPKPQPPPPAPSKSIPLAPGTMIGSSVVVFKVNTPKEPIMPQPIIETVPVVLMPKPIQEVVKTPRKRPVPMPIQEPPPSSPIMGQNVSPLRTARQIWNQSNQSPRQISPRSRSPMAVSPRTRSPMPRMMVTSPVANMVRPPGNIRTSTVSMVQRNLFPSPPANPSLGNPTPIEGTLHVGPKADGSYGYHVRLSDGGIINLSREDIEILRQNNNGNLPSVVKFPLRQNNRIMF